MTRLDTVTLTGSVAEAPVPKADRCSFPIVIEFPDGDDKRQSRTVSCETSLAHSLLLRPADAVRVTGHFDVRHFACDYELPEPKLIVEELGID